MKPIVLHVAPMPPQLGGMEAFAGHLMPALARYVDVIVLDIAKPLLFAQPNYRVHVGYTLFKRPWRHTLLSYAYSAGAFKKFLLLLRYRGIDLIHIHTASYTSFWEKCLYILAARLAGKPVVLHVHGALFDQFYDSSPPIVRSIIRLFLAQCRSVIVLGEKWRRFFQKVVSEQKLTVIENGIALPAALKRAPHAGPLVFLHLGEISERKGISDLLRAFSLVKEQRSDFILRLVGGGQLGAAAQLVETLGLGANVEILGPKVGDEKWEMLFRSDVFVLASHAEGMPIALIEALAAGLPIIAAKAGSVPEMIQDGRNGFLIEPGDFRGLATTALTLLSSPILCESMGRENRSLAERRFDIRICAEKMARLYRHLLSN
ncbi:MAG: glycosyltransferase family 4 protein [candidate division KSB1 bacterium]|nr:glycosyltransferase family 4 protein [candidate division KSB1 bacterium]MDZ7346132.1 glycosyltransferase family 4 protein [candidate division KSB1 bacterium]